MGEFSFLCTLRFSPPPPFLGILGLRHFNLFAVIDLSLHVHMYENEIKLRRIGINSAALH